MVRPLQINPEHATVVLGDSSNHFQCFGEARVKKVCSLHGFSESELTRPLENLCATKEVARNIFLRLLDIRKEDVEELEGPIAKRFKQLIPFENIEEMGITAKEKESVFRDLKLEHFKVDRPTSSGKGLQGLSERIYVVVQHHFQVLKEATPEEKMLCDAEMLSSRLADREIQKGQAIHLSDGYFYADEIFTAGGAYVAILKDFEGVKAPKIVCRGTASTPNATSGLKSGLNNILLEVGTLGVKSIWPALSKYLTENSIQSVEVLGKSLGGAHAQQLAILIEGVLHIKIENLTTCGSVGISESINQVFQDKVLAQRVEPFNIHVIRNGGEGAISRPDYIPFVGEKHLGAGALPEKCHTDVYYLGSSEEEVIAYPETSSFVSVVKNFVHSFGFAHCRQTTLGKFIYKKVDPEKLQDHLGMEQRLERVRKAFAYGIHALTFFKLNGSSFREYFLSQEAALLA
jgi:hypothetical protein